jgi:hypothetical protein
VRRAAADSIRLPIERTCGDMSITSLVMTTARHAVTIACTRVTVDCRMQSIDRPATLVAEPRPAGIESPTGTMEPLQDPPGSSTTARQQTRVMAAPTLTAVDLSIDWTDDAMHTTSQGIVIAWRRMSIAGSTTAMMNFVALVVGAAVVMVRSVLNTGDSRSDRA